MRTPSGLLVALAFGAVLVELAAGVHSGAGLIAAALAWCAFRDLRRLGESADTFVCESGPLRAGREAPELYLDATRVCAARYRLFARRAETLREGTDRITAPAFGAEGHDAAPGAVAVDYAKRILGARSAVWIVRDAAAGMQVEVRGADTTYIRRHVEALLDRCAPDRELIYETELPGLGLAVGVSFFGQEQEPVRGRGALWVAFPPGQGIPAAAVRCCRDLAIVTVNEIRRRESDRAFSAELERLELARARTSRMMAELSHDLRSPLQTIRTNLSLLAERDADGANPLVRSMERTSSALHEMCEDLLVCSRAQNGDLEVRHETFDLAVLAREVTESLQGLAAEKRLSLIVQVESRAGREYESVVVRAPRRLARRALMNVVHNGLSYTDRGGVTLRFVSTREQVSLHVVDTGRGIDREQKRVDGSERPGSGFGLPTTAALMERCDGSLALKPREEGGTEAILTFRRPSTGSMAEERAGERLLVVDDDEECARSLCTAAQADGFDAAYVTTLADAHRALLAEPGIEYMLLDWRIGEGAEHLLAGLERADRDLAVLVVTGDFTVELEPPAFHGRPLPVILKPVDTVAILTRVRQLRLPIEIPDPAHVARRIASE